MGLKTIKTEELKSINEEIPTEEWYYFAAIKQNDYWQLMTCFGKDPRIKQNAIDEVMKWDGSERKIVKIAMPLILSKS